MKSSAEPDNEHPYECKIKLINKDIINPKKRPPPIVAALLYMKYFFSDSEDPLHEKLSLISRLVLELNSGVLDKRPANDTNAAVNKNDTFIMIPRYNAVKKIVNTAPKTTEISNTVRGETNFFISHSCPSLRLSLQCRDTSHLQ